VMALLERNASWVPCAGFGECWGRISRKAAARVKNASVFACGS